MLRRTDDSMAEVLDALDRSGGAAELVEQMNDLVDTLVAPELRDR